MPSYMSSGSAARSTPSSLAINSMEGVGGALGLVAACLTMSMLMMRCNNPHELLV